MEQNRNKWSLEDELEFDIGYALAKEKLPPRRSKDESPASLERRRQRIARSVAQRLLKRYDITRAERRYRGI